MVNRTATAPDFIHNQGAIAALLEIEVMIEEDTPMEEEGLDDDGIT
jgi:hypothetical protein